MKRQKKNEKRGMDSAAVREDAGASSEVTGWVGGSQG